MKKQATNYLVRVRAVPCDGVRMERVAKGEYLLIREDDEQRNMWLMRGTVEAVMRDALNGGASSEFNYGFKTFWDIATIGDDEDDED